MKLLGALLLVLGTYAVGHVEALKRERRVHQLSAMIAALGLLESHIVYGRTLLSDALWQAGEARPEVRRLFWEANQRLRQGEAASTAWREAVAVWARHSAFRPGDLRPLEHLAGVLGLTSAEDQARHMRLVTSQLEAGLVEARERLPEQSRLCRALGVCGGLTLALLLY